MTEATDITFAARRSDDVRLVAGVSAAHFISHFYMLVLPPLFAFVRADYAVSYTELGLTLTAFNAVSAILQTPAGFLIDRINARIALVIGLLLGAIGFAVAAAVNSYWVLVAMFGVIGLGNTVYHPANYALLSRYIGADRVGQAFSVHSFAGMMGTACAPAAALFMHSLFGWRGAFVGAAVLGTLVALVLLFQSDYKSAHVAVGKPRDTHPTPTDWRVLLTPAILINFVFFAVYAFASFGLQNFTVVALGALYGTDPVAANSALAGYLTLMAFGVLMGGYIASRITHHRLIACLGLSSTAMVALLIGTIDVGALMLVMVMALAGLSAGAVMPSRDMIVREVTPPGAFGTVFAFVTTGYHVAGIVAPLLFGALLDHGGARAMFYIIAAFTVLSIVTVACVPKPR